MKKSIILLLFISVFLFSSCSVQETMSPQIFFERLSHVNSQLCLDSSEQFYEGNEFVCFVSDLNANNYAFQISVNDNGDCEKISLACNKTDKASDFISCAKSVIQTYSPNDDADVILNQLYSGGEIRQEYVYYDTQWHKYSAAASDAGFFFSVSSKKLIPESEVELSLKPNDKVDF